MAGLQKAMTASRLMGFGGSLCIHPDHVETINKVFAPTKE